MMNIMHIRETMMDMMQCKKKILVLVLQSHAKGILLCVIVWIMEKKMIWW